MFCVLEKIFQQNNFGGVSYYLKWENKEEYYLFWSSSIIVRCASSVLRLQFYNFVLKTTRPIITILRNFVKFMTILYPRPHGGGKTSKKEPNCKKKKNLLYSHPFWKKINAWLRRPWNLYKNWEIHGALVRGSGPRARPLWTYS